MCTTVGLVGRVNGMRVHFTRHDQLHIACIDLSDCESLNEI